MKRLLYGVTTAQGADTTSATNALIVRNSAGNVLLGITNDGAVRVGTNASATTQTTASINASGSGTNIGLALVPKGTGALTAQIPDGAVTGGSTRGINAVDLQTKRSNANQVAAGSYSVVGGGWDNRASGTDTVVVGGYTNSATANGSFIGGGYLNTTSDGFAIVVGGFQNTASGSNSFIAGGNSNSASGGGSSVSGGHENAASATFSNITGGYQGRAQIYGQRTHSSGRFSGNSDSQTSDIRLRRAITGTAASELFLDGASVRAVLSLPSGSTAGRVWNAKIQVVAVCTVQGAGTVTVGEVFGGNYAAIIKRIGNTTSLVGTVQNLHTAQTDTNMATAAVTITADDTNESLKIEFTPPTTAAADTVIRVVATVYLTEVGY